MSRDCYCSPHLLLGEPGSEGLYMRLTGQSLDGLERYQGHYLASAVIEPFIRLKEKASEAGFDLQIASGYRSFERQAAIWRAKSQGQRALLDRSGKAVDFHQLTPAQLLKVIMNWSAIPGTSRHHWGTDIDVYDAKSLPEGYSLQLTQEECEPEGILGDFHRWLSELIANDASCGFYRPYVEDRGGVLPEPWHLSFGPCASILEQSYDLSVFSRLVAQMDIPLVELIREQKQSLFESYVLNIHSAAESSSC